MCHKSKSILSLYLSLKNEYSFITLYFKRVNGYFYKSRIILYASDMGKILISACLAGNLVRHDGKMVILIKPG